MKLTAAALLVLLAYTTGSPIPQPEDGSSYLDQEPPNSRGKNVYPRVYNGSDATEAQFPFMAILADSDGSFCCGGSIIDTQWILTAAHCVYSPGMPIQNLSVVVGSIVISNGTIMPNQKRVRVATVNIHPGYVFDYNSKEKADFDIALLQLEEKLEWSETVQPIKMPEPNTDSQYEEGTPVTVAGWGLTENGSLSDTLQYLESEFAPTEACVNQWKLLKNRSITENMICIGKMPLYAHAWFGDSGGPRFSMGTDGWVQYAIVSFGDLKIGSVNTRLDRFVRWAFEVMVDINQTIAVQHNLTGPFGEWHEKQIDRYDYHRIQLNAESNGFVNLDIKFNYHTMLAKLYIYQGVVKKSNIIGTVSHSSPITEFSFRATRANEPLYLEAIAFGYDGKEGGVWGTYGKYAYRATLVQSESSPSPDECPPGYWQCDDGRECISEKGVCDGKIADCSDGSDEMEETCDAFWRCFEETLISGGRINCPWSDLDENIDIRNSSQTTSNSSQTTSNPPQATTDLVNGTTLL